MSAPPRPVRPSLAVSLTEAFPRIHRERPDTGRVGKHVEWWLARWSGQTEERVRVLVEVYVGGYPKISVEVRSRCAGGDKLLADVRAAGGVMDL